MTAKQIREKLENPGTNEDFFSLLPYVFDKKFDIYLSEIYSDCLTYAYAIYPHTKFSEKKVTKIKKWDNKTVESLFYPIVLKDDLVPSLGCVKVDKNWIVATDKHILCRTINYTDLAEDVYRLNKIAKLATTENLISNLHPVWPENHKFPDYEPIIPNLANAMEIKEIKIIELYNFLFHYLKNKVYLHTGNNWSKAAFYGKVDIHFNAKKMLTVLEFIQKIGDTSCKMYLYEHNKAIRIISENTDSILMPLMYEPEDTALDCSKFLI